MNWVSWLFLGLLIGGPILVGILELRSDKKLGIRYDAARGHWVVRDSTRRSR